MIKYYWSRVPLEAILWTIALIVLACYDPQDTPHLSLCPLHNLGFSFCPGCGLGRSMAYFLHGEIRQAFATHPLGIISVIVLSFRIVQQTRNYYNTLWHE